MKKVSIREMLREKMQAKKDYRAAREQYLAHGSRTLKEKGTLYLRREQLYERKGVCRHQRPGIGPGRLGAGKACPGCAPDGTPVGPTARQDIRALWAWQPIFTKAQILMGAWLW